MKWTLLAAACVLLAGLTSERAGAQSLGNGPCAMVIGFKSAPQDRPAFRAYLEKSGAAQFERWQHEGVFASYQLLFSVSANQDLNDLTVILHFDHFADQAKWEKVERLAAGGLATAAHYTAVPMQSEFADSFRSGSLPGRDPRKAVCMIIPYQVPGSMAEYQKYADEYVIPQMEGWMKHGVMGAYALYVNQNPAGAKWATLLVQEYVGYEGLAQREVMKDQVRQELDSNPRWKHWAQNKGDIRHEGRPIVALPILPP
jgi:hypothetical protein